MNETKTVVCQLPHKYEAANYKVNSAGLARVRKRTKSNAYTCLCVAGVPSNPWSGATYTVIVYTETRRNRDEDNFIHSLKATLDGIAADKKNDRKGLVADDSGFRFVGPIDWQIDKLNPRVELRFERLEN